MKKLWLVYITEQDKYYNEEERVVTFDSNADTTRYVNEIASGSREGTNIKKVLEVDPNYSTSTIKEMIATLSGFKLELVHKTSGAK